MAIEKTDQTVKPVKVRIAVILIAIFIDNRSLYTKLGNATVQPKKFLEYIKDLNFNTLNDSFHERYVIFIAMASCMRREANEELNQIIELCLEYAKDMNSSENPEVNKSTMMNHLTELLGERMDNLYKQSAFQRIYARLEEWKAFIE